MRAAKGIQHPSLAALPGGGFVVVWSEPTSNWAVGGARANALLRTAAPSPGAAFVLRSRKNVVAAWFDADGQLTRGPFVVNQSATGVTTVNWYVQVAADANGAVLVAWRPWESGDVLARFFDAQGNTTSGEIQLSPEPSRYFGDVAVAAMEPGRFVTIWNELDDSQPYDRHLLLARTVAVDGTLGNVFPVSPTDAPADQLLPSVVIEGSGRLLVTWFNEVGEQTVQARFLDDGSPTPAFDIAGANQERRPRACALNSGEVIFAWEGYQSAFEPPRVVNDGAWFRRYNALGQPLGDPLPVLSADRSQHVSGFVCPANGIPMIVIDYRNVLIGRSLKGTALTTEFEIVRTYGGAAGSLVGETDVVSVSGDDFVVTWAECFDPSVNQEPECELRAQMFSRSRTASCRGDCNLDGQVTIDELVLATRIAGSSGSDMRACLPADRNLDYRLDISELVGAVATSLGGCQ